jgi:tetrahydromethanopterin S-methyltransferase subunit B
MSDEELEKKIHLAGALGCAFGFICGAGLMMLVAIIF